MRKRGGRPRRLYAKRHPNGSVVRTTRFAGVVVSLSWLLNLPDKIRARRDPREGTEAGRLELDGKITKLERLAGEQYAKIIEVYRVRCSLAPSPNPAASNPQKSTGKVNDTADLTPDDERRMREAAANLTKVQRAFRIRNGTMAALRIHDLFVLDQPVPDATLPLVRKGLRRLQVELGLSGPPRTSAEA